MRFKRFGRTLFCLLLVCCLMFDIATIPARAMVVQDLLNMFFAGEWVVSSIFKALGTGQGQSSDYFNNAVADCWDYLCDVVGFGVNGMAAVTRVSDGTDIKYMVTRAFVEACRAWLFDAGVVSTAVSVPDNVNALDLYNESFSVCSSYSFAFVTFASDGRWAMGYSNGDNPCFIADGGSWIISNASGAGTVTSPNNSSIANISSWGGSWRNSGSVSLLDSVSFFGTSAPDVVTSQDLILQSLVAPSVPIATGYADWTANAVTVEAATEEEEAEVYYPIALGNSYEETAAMTQEQVWAGASTYVEVTVDSEISADSVAATPWATFTSWISGVFADLKAAVVAIPAAITDFFTFDTDISAYAIELTSFFPFCIPWDIYHFFELFLAEPEAPYLEFDVPFPYMEEAWHIEIDLSAWDTVATVARVLELIAFIVGLAVFTREKFLRG